MRMWNVDPKMMCTKHLLGEHVEMHMFVGSIVKGVSMKGYIQGGLIETQKLLERHNDLAAELERRGFLHQSPLRSDFDIEPAGVVNIEANLAELARRCPECALHQEKGGWNPVTG